MGGRRAVWAGLTAFFASGRAKSIDQLRAELSGLASGNSPSTLETLNAGGAGHTDRETFGPASDKKAATIATGHVHNIQPSFEVEAMTEADPPLRPPVVTANTPMPLDIPEPEQARKLYEYDD